MKHLDCLPGTVIHCGVFTNWRPFEIICYYVAKGADKIPPPFHLGKTHFIMNSIPNICHFLHCFGVILPHYFGIISPWLSGRPTNHDGYQFWLIIPPKFIWVFLNRKNNNDILACSLEDFNLQNEIYRPLAPPITVEISGNRGMFLLLYLNQNHMVLCC